MWYSAKWTLWSHEIDSVSPAGETQCHPDSIPDIMESMEDANSQRMSKMAPGPLSRELMVHLRCDSWSSHSCKLLWSVSPPEF
jgi:hypothetical protein